MKKYDMFAFPTSESNDHHGMTLRDYFAAKALAGLAHDYHAEGRMAEGIADECYELADAMLEAREK